MKTIDRPNALVANAAIDQATFQFATGIVSTAHTDQFTVVGSVPLTAKRAASCNCVPEVGDTVLYGRSDTETWIIAVLVSHGSRTLDLSATQVNINAQEIQMHSAAWKTTSVEWKAQHGEIALSASTIQATVGAVHWVSNKLTALIDLCFSRQRRLMREVSEIETVQCGNYSLQADNTLSINAQTGLVTAKGMMKIDATQIHIG